MSAWKSLFYTSCLASLATVSLIRGAAAQDVAYDSSLRQLEAPPTPGGTLPPVEVRPNEQIMPDYDPYAGEYSGRYDAYGNPGLSWRSGLIGSDMDYVGPYGQPVWTTQRPWATTRAYVLPAGTAQVEQWVRPTWGRGDKVEYRMLEELAIGLPGRFQLDIYERWNIEPNGVGTNQANHEGVQIELRWAVADWGVIPLNPTFYIEWVERGGPQDKANKYEAKLLLADNLADYWYFASNIILEQEVEDERETELGWSNAISTTIIDRKLLAGVEMVLSGTNVQGNRGSWDVSLMIGPSLQYRPTNRTFLDVVGLFGTTGESPHAQMYIIAGFQFGTRASPYGAISGPAATRGN